ncbi:uncharacterized protein LOC120691094 [Panicum virgatum]|uniref:Uncharacterized protein n=1 Tax=Panicum virgatum TaxID=38727 RepID=A0A8T0MGC3_PANVG|nr:uncharacterized protein LOC120691094 [Panicum virgatum]KAG2536157.1 hypothetical protein PVAP13_9NG094846 [Panicum virgatum]
MIGSAVRLPASAIGHIDSDFRVAFFFEQRDSLRGDGGGEEGEAPGVRQAVAMCYQVKCGTCGKSTWAGCGRHVASVHRQIPEGQHCACRGWPGVAPAGDKKAAAAGDSAAAEGSSSTSACTIL